MFKVLIAASVSVFAVIASNTIPRSLAEMVDTERAFAKMASDATIRDAFLEYFADQSVNFNPDPGPARERLRVTPDAFPAGMRLVWEPRLGDISSSGDLGYLTGPATTDLPGQPTRHGSYFSVWKKQPNGSYRVILDVGVAPVDAAEFAPGFVRAGAVPAYTGKDTRENAEHSLLETDRAFGLALASQGAAKAYAAALHASGRLHRNGSPLMSTRKAAVDWTHAHVKAMRSEPLKVETAAARDLGYTWGTYSMEPTQGAVSKGYYIRVWTRDANGAWQLAADVTQRSS